MSAALGTRGLLDAAAADVADAEDRVAAALDELDAARERRDRIAAELELEERPRGPRSTAERSPTAPEHGRAQAALGAAGLRLVHGGAR